MKKRCLLCADRWVAYRRSIQRLPADGTPGEPVITHGLHNLCICSSVAKLGDLASPELNNSGYEHNGEDCINVTSFVQATAADSTSMYARYTTSLTLSNERDAPT